MQWKQFHCYVEGFIVVEAILQSYPVGRYSHCHAHPYKVTIRFTILDRVLVSFAPIEPVTGIKFQPITTQSRNALLDKTVNRHRELRLITDKHRYLYGDN